MMNIVIFLCQFFFLLFLGCNNETANDLKKKSIPFDPNSNLTVDQMKKWLSCNPRLDSLSYRYIDSLKTENSDIRRIYQENFIKMQDNICIEQGLSGGYKEYVWILKNSGTMKNRKVLDTLGLKKF